MSSEKLGELDQLLTCCVCLETYRNPKLLPCQHSICLEPCLMALVDHELHQVRCPECRAEHKILGNGVKAFPTNITLQRFLQFQVEITGELPTQTLEFDTKDKLEYIWIPTPEANCVVFKVLAAHDAHIALSKVKTEAHPMLEVFIGGWMNTKSIIRKNQAKPDVVEKATPDILSDREFRGFWIRWSDNNITVGHQDCDDAFMSYDRTDKFPINFIGLCTGWGASGSWIINKPPSLAHDESNESVDVMITTTSTPILKFETQDKLEYTFFPTSGANGVVFRVKAAHDAHIALTSSEAESDPMLEVFLGGWSNSKSVIRKNRTKPEVAEEGTPEILNSGEFRGFWIRWTDNNIAVGREGEAAAFLSYENTDAFPINYVGICTGWGASGSWIVEAPQASARMSAGGSAVWVATSGSAIPEGALVGGDDNGEPLIVGRAHHEGALLPGKVVPGHGVCYVAWGGGEHGKPEYEVLVGNGIWMTGTGSDIPPNATPEFETQDKLEYTFFPTSGANGVVFRVKAAHDAHIALTSSEAESDPMLEVFLGGWSNSKSVIRKNRTKPEVAEEGTPEILNGGEFRGFWIRWTDNNIAVGREGEAAAFLSYENTDAFPINYVGICTGWGASGGFDNGEELIVGRAHHEGALLPGKVVPEHGVCYVAWGGGEHAKAEYEVLVGNATWVAGTGSDIPPNATPAGESEDGEPLFVGRIAHLRTVTCGKVQPSHGVCYISYAGEELSSDDYELLVI